MCYKDQVIVMTPGHILMKPDWKDPKADHKT